MAIKAALPKHFSIVVFGLTQIALDLEVLWYLVRWYPPLHRFWHTYLGATIIAAVFALAGKPASQWIKSIWNHISKCCPDIDLSVPVRTSWLASAAAAALGAYSHILLDSLFHPDIEPLQPWSESNPLFGIINPMMLQIGCVILGIIGLVWFFGREQIRRNANKVSEDIDASAPNPQH